MARTRQQFSYRNGRDGAAQDGQRGDIDEMSGAQAKQELAEARNTIAQFRKNQEPFKRQRREGYNNYRREQENNSYGQDQQGAARKNVTGPEGSGPGPKQVASPPKIIQVKMLRTSRESSDSDEEPECERAYCVLARVS